MSLKTRNPVRAILQVGGARFEISAGSHREEYDIALLPSKIAFYKHMASLPDTRNGVSRRKVYGPIYAALKVLQAEVGA